MLCIVKLCGGLQPYIVKYCAINLAIIFPLASNLAVVEGLAGRTEAFFHELLKGFQTGTQCCVSYLPLHNVG